MDIEKEIKALRHTLDKSFAKKISTQISEERMEGWVFSRFKAPFGLAKKISILINQEARRKREGFMGIWFLLGSLILLTLVLLPNLNSFSAIGSEILGNVASVNAGFYLFSLILLGISVFFKNKILSIFGNILAASCFILILLPFTGNSDIKNDSIALKIGNDLVLNHSIQKAIVIGGSIKAKPNVKIAESLAIGGNIEYFGPGKTTSLIGKVYGKESIKASSDILDPKQWPMYLLGFSAVFLAVFERFRIKIKLPWMQILSITGLIWFISLPVALGIGSKVIGNSPILLSIVIWLPVFLLGLGLSAKKIGNFVGKWLKLPNSQNLKTSIGFIALLICLYIPNVAIIIWPIASFIGFALASGSRDSSDIA